MKSCVFCQIANGKLPADIVYEDRNSLVIIPKKMEAKGHLLVIPKKHYENIFDIKKKHLEKLIVVSKKMALLLRNKLGATGVNILHASGKDAQQSVNHFHLHLIPRYKNDGLDTWMKKPGKKDYDRNKLLRVIVK